MGHPVYTHIPLNMFLCAGGGLRVLVRGEQLRLPRGHRLRRAGVGGRLRRRPRGGGGGGGGGRGQHLHVLLLDASLLLTTNS